MTYSSGEESDVLVSDDDDTEFLRDLAWRRMRAVKDAKDHNGTIHGSLYHCSHEREIVEATTCTPHLVIHFKDPEFKRCRIMTEHLIKLATLYECTKFMEIRAQEAPFLVAKMNVKVLPCLICVVNAQAVDRIIGFEELGEDDDFETSMLEARLKKCNVLKK
jgi:thioredoxin-like negative regulator of GroEL